VADVKGGERLKAKLAELGEKLGKGGQLDVGFLAGATEADGTSVALVAALNEFGTGRMPPRPFMRPTVANNKSKWGPNLGTALKATNYDPMKSLDLLGEEIVGEIKQTINSVTSPKLAESTIARKGFEKPLIDTSTMINSVDKKVT